MERMHNPTQPARPGRPPLSREAAMEEIRRLPRVGRHQVRINARRMAERLGCDRSTVGRMVNDLVAEGKLRRMKNGGKVGLHVAICAPEEGTVRFYQPPFA